MYIWRIESSPVKQTALSVITLLVGGMLLYGFRNFDASGLPDSLAGFLLGGLLFLIGLPGLITGGKEAITFDPHSKTILIENVNRFRTNRRYIGFNEVSDVRTTSIGHRSDGSITYYLLLDLKNGKKVPLFYPSYYDGRFSSYVAEERCEKAKEYIGIQKLTLF